MLAQPVASITFTALDNSLRTFAPVSDQRATYVVLRLGELATLAPYITLSPLWGSICVRGMVQCQNSKSRMMIGIGTPSSQRSAPRAIGCLRYVCEDNGVI